MNVLVLIPAHNEGKAIGALVAGVVKKGYHVAVVDDGSVDDTAVLARKAGAHVLQTGRKSGKGNALRTGFNYAVSKNYTAVIAMDGDGQHAPEDIARFITCAENTAAFVVNGNRMSDPRGMPLVRRWTNRLMSWLISRVCGQHIADTQCGFRLIRTEVLRNVTLECTDFEIETELLVKASRRGYKILSVPVQTIYGDEVSKIRPVRDTIRFICFMWRSINTK